MVIIGKAYMEIQYDNLIDSNPTLRDFYSDLNKHDNAVYDIRKNGYVIEFEKDISDKEEGRITIWKAQKKHGKYVPSQNNNSKYDWYPVARRFTEFNPEVVETITNSDYHFQQTLENYPYDGPKVKMDVTIIE